MARKKSRPAAKASSSTAVLLEPARPSSAPAVPVVAEHKAAAVSPFRQTPLGGFLYRVFYLFASLKLAIPLLALFTTCLAIATFVESSYNGRIAGELVYRTWWFALLLTLLAANILCAALKKYPWKKHQTGFLITHLGLITLVGGGLLTALFGVEGQIRLIDTPDKTIQAQTGLPNSGNIVDLDGQHRLEVFKPSRSVLHDQDRFGRLKRAIDGGHDLDQGLKGMLDQSWDLKLSPGSFAWHDDEYLQTKLPMGISILKAFSSPFPSFSQDLDGQATLTVENYYPATEYWPHSAATRDETAPVFPAIRLALSGGEGGKPFLEEWVTGAFDGGVSNPLLSYELTTVRDPLLVEEFLQPPSPRDARLGPQGQLVLVLGPAGGRKLFRIPVDKDRLNENVDLGDSGYKVKLTDYTNLLVDEAKRRREKDFKPENLPLYPLVKLELTGPDGKKRQLEACARRPHLLRELRGQDEGPEGVSLWYHYPDFRFGEKEPMGSLQFLQGPGDKLYYRVYGKNGLKEKGHPIDPRDPGSSHTLPLQGGMVVKFGITEYLPRAVARESVVPRDVPPGTDSERLQPALRATLTVGGKSKEFWVRMGRGAARVVVGSELYLVRYSPDHLVTDFTLTLKQALERKDPGSDRAAAFESLVLLSTQPDGKGPTSEHRIYMNHPLDYGMFKVYQANYRALTQPRSMELIVDNDRKVSFSGLQVAYDPGLWFKYAGTALVVLGIATMFYMKAYFFKPSGKRPPDEEAVVNEVVLPSA
jgi:hypothetical protein